MVSPIVFRLLTTLKRVVKLKSRIEVSKEFWRDGREKTIGPQVRQEDDALWLLGPLTTPIGCTLYKLVYGKACHLPVELEYKAYWALKHANFDLKTAGDHRKLQLNET
ncbi:hypothetical protein Tco_0387005 [Tanacetum coccineum]